MPMLLSCDDEDEVILLSDMEVLIEYQGLIDLIQFGVIPEFETIPVRGWRKSKLIIDIDKFQNLFKAH